jgi:hypothetical protein
MMQFIYIYIYFFSFFYCSKAAGAEQVSTPTDPRMIPDKKQRMEFITKAQSSLTSYMSRSWRAMDE